MPASKGIGYYNHGPHLHEYLEEFHRDVFSHYDCMVLAEAPMISPKKALEYIDEHNKPVLDMMIQFATQDADCLFMDFNHIPFSLRKLKRAYSGWQNGLEGRGWNMLYIENHDHPRMVSRCDSEKFRSESAKMLVVCSYTEKEVPFSAPKGFDISSARLILQNYAKPEPSLLKPYEVRVYLLEK